MSDRGLSASSATLAGWSSRVAVIKVGGSVLTARSAYRRVAQFVANRVAEATGTRLVIVISAEHGTTDALLEEARNISPEPDPAALDLLWSTGEVRSVAFLVMSLHALGVRAAGLNVHQTGLTEPDVRTTAGNTELRTLRLRAALAAHDVVVVPGFLARSAGDSIVSLGRGGSDLTAVLLAAGLGAESCELVKDVPGYFSDDPKRSHAARHLPFVTFERALSLAEDGCSLVQREALETARARKVALIVRSLEDDTRTIVTF